MVTINSQEVEHAFLTASPNHHPLFTNQRAFMMTTNGTIDVKLLGTSSSQDRSRTDADWEQISSMDTDSVMSSSAGSNGLANQLQKQHPAENSDKVLFQTNYESSISMNLRRKQLHDFYAGAYPSSALQTFHQEKVQRMNLTALDPSMLLGFLVKDEADCSDTIV
ncbi:Cysteine protease atg4 [Puccinia graminis f. sp. tritici]|uniref:Cysteine protease n=1 Tax=Puccinia graminis f. sp. tritici TaxID=56615 RepID=A0A5B0P838_PUCGR|nr:Cysteine protease atg4 [Puccinia graminis f. sp. tritici]